MLAMVIDDAVVNWIVAGLAVAIPSAGTTIVVLWRKLIAFLKPYITGFFDSHTQAFKAQTELAVEMKSQIPVVANTLQKLGETQEKQCETLEQHGLALEQHGTTIETILKEVRRSNPDIRTDKK